MNVHCNIAPLPLFVMCSYSLLGYSSNYQIDFVFYWDPMCGTCYEECNENQYKECSGRYTVYDFLGTHTRYYGKKFSDWGKAGCPKDD
ncbi:unnamed protein product [Cylicostephanus goldi]|uniref:Uncharacterized protein n=1 Tax=Cylicostephanus goldi TaxID=71465 RepID=A0A3P6R7X6_CYLGO|nr:unnamed protein product [Cylicostephanus goldi]